MKPPTSTPGSAPVSPSPGGALLRLMRRVESTPGLDPPSELLRSVIQGALPAGAVRDLLRGNWLGHSFHPLLTDFVEGPWMAATFLDLFGPPESAGAARRLLGLGLLAAIPTYLTGLLEWAEEERIEQRRVGLVHIASISTATVLYTASYLSRRGGRRGRLLAVAAGLVAFADGYAGGHMAHVRLVATGELH